MRFIPIFLILILMAACARQGSPSGGPKDETPPRYLNSNPDTLALQVPTHLREIKINFDEYLVLKETNKNIVVSPPFKGNPTFMPMGSPAKSIRIKLNEDLEPNTTYSINFGNAIQDHNEGNKLPYFQFVFSTGDYIDSLEISGKAILPKQRKQSENLMVALFKTQGEFNDSVIFTQKPDYVAKVNESGAFKLNYLHTGNYQLIAFEDEVQNMQFDLGKEKLGFLDQPIELNENQEFQLELFDQQPPYKVGKADQKDYGHLVFRFSGQPENVRVESLDFDFTTAKSVHQFKRDSLDFWFNPSVDSIPDKNKRLKFLVKNNNQTDTVSVVYSNSMKHQLKLERKNNFDISPTQKPYFKVNYPIAELDASKVVVWKDTVQLDVKLILDEENKQGFTLDFPIEWNSKYRYEIHPEAVLDFFGNSNDTIKNNLQTKIKNDYGNLKLKLENLPEKPFWIQLMDKEDRMLDERYSTQTEFDYFNLNPGQYYFRLLIDENENGFWDTGDFFMRKQAEKSYLYPEMIHVRTMWDVEEVWVLPKEAIKEEEIEE